MPTKVLKLSKIDHSAGTQIRAALNEATVAEYAEAMLDATNHFPPVIVFGDGSGDYILADGFHRVMAAVRNDFKDIEADVRKGSFADALRYALGANSAHGLRLTPDDRKKSITLALTQWPDMSDRELARTCVCSPSTVSSYRAKVSKLDTLIAPEVHKGKDGKEYPAKHDTAKPAPAPAPSPALPAARPVPSFYAQPVCKIVDEALKSATQEQLKSLLTSLTVSLKAVQDRIDELEF